MHPKDDLLRALIDQELAGPRAQQLAEHLAGCPACRERLSELKARAEWARAGIDRLAPGPQEMPRSTQAAYARFTNNPRKLHQKKEWIQPMFTRRPLWTALAIIALLVVVFTLTPASAWANSFLGLFRVQKVQVITFNPAAAENAKGQLEANQEAIKQVFQNDLKVTRQGESTPVSSVEEAAQKAGFTPRIPARLNNAQLTVEPGMNAVLTIDQPKMQALADAMGVKVDLPASLNGKDVTVDSAASVAATQNCSAAQVEREKDMPENCISFVQMPSPSVNTPEGLDVPQLGAAMFQFLGMPADQAAALSEKIDWTTTLVLPVPQSGQVKYQEVQVDGVTGTLLEEVGQSRYMLIWVKDGMLYGLSGPGTGTQAMTIVSGLK